jgi:hypothetical protein
MRHNGRLPRDFSRKSTEIPTAALEVLSPPG